MPPATPPDAAPDQLQWLVDRAAITDLLVDFARTLDDRDWAGYAANYAPEGELGFGDRVAHKGRDGLAEFVAAGVGRYARTHHFGANHAITIDGDTATARSYLVAAHVLDAEDADRHFDGGGWYRYALRRTDEGWRFTRVMLEIVFTTGRPLAHPQA